jgi:magnesium transporter
MAYSLLYSKNDRLVPHGRFKMRKNAMTPAGSPQNTHAAMKTRQEAKMGSASFYHILKTGRLDRVLSVSKALELKKQGGFIWLHYLEPVVEDFAPLIDQLGLHPLSVEDVFDTNQIPKIDDFPDNTFVLVNAFSHTGGVLSVQEINLFLGADFLVSVDRNDPDGKPYLDGIEEIVVREVGNAGKFGPAYVMHTILDVIVDRKFTALEVLEDDLSAAEDAVLDRSPGFSLRSLQTIRRSLVTVRKCLYHEREIFVKICRKDCPLIPEKAIFHYRDVYDHLTRFFELTETLRDIATSLMEIDISLRSNEMTRASNRTNASVRRLTFITTIFLPMTLLSGIGGMSEWSMMTGPSNWRIAYPLFLLAMVGIGSASYFLLKKIVKNDESGNDPS